VAPTAIAASEPSQALRTTPEEDAKPGVAWHEQTPYGLEGPPIQARRELSAPSPLTPPAAPSPTRRFAEAPDDDGTPYGVSEKLSYRCQECGRVLHGEVVLCPSCGFNHETGTKAERLYEPVYRTWESGLPFERRMRLFIITQAVMVVMAAVSSWATGNLFAVLPGWVMIAGLTAFVIGTYDRVDLTRTNRGKVSLKHTWRFCFVERPTKTLPLGQFEGITRGKVHDPSFWDWVGLFLLLGCGIIPGIVFWYYCIYSEQFFVALTKDHGHPEFTLYRGWSEKHMKDLYGTVRSVAFPTETR
jgi:hypothetical protein